MGALIGDDPSAESDRKGVTGKEEQFPRPLPTSLPGASGGATGPGGIGPF
jgi:hypothetical protein